MISLGPQWPPYPIVLLRVIPAYAEVTFYHLMLIFVISGTAQFLATRTLSGIPKGAVMNNAKKDVATLIELLKMADERRANFKPDQISQNHRISEDSSLLEMWPEACRRTGVGNREFPPRVIELWKQSLGRAN